MRKNIDVSNIFLCFKLMVDFFFNYPIVSMCLDEGGEYYKLKSFFLNRKEFDIYSPFLIDHNTMESLKDVTSILLKYD